MDLKKLSEPFKENEIEWRVGQCGKTREGKIWAKVLAYVQARAIMDRFDEACGPENWMVTYRFIGLNESAHPGVICGIGVRVRGDWIHKEDGAEQTDIESFKGGLSSALKRAAVPWGPGRYLYDLEEGWAQIVDQKAPGARYAKTKEGETFYWVPPALPAWALPAVEQNKTATVVTEAPKITPKASTPPNERLDLGKKIKRLTVLLQYTDHDIVDWTQRMWGKGPQDLTIEEMTLFKATLEKDCEQAGVKYA